MSVTKGIEARRVARRMVGDSARSKGLAIRSWVANVNVDDVECMSLGRLRSLRAVRIDRTKGKRENKRSPVVSPHVGSVSPSHMKLPTNAQIADMNNVAGINTDVMIITGRTNIRRRST
jgi:hypothetical protein